MRTRAQEGRKANPYPFGRIELVTPEQRLRLHAIGEAPPSTKDWVYDLVRETRERLTFDSASIHPQWDTPDWITFARARDGEWDVFWMSPSGCISRPIFTRERPQWEAVLSADLDLVAFMEALTSPEYEEQTQAMNEAAKTGAEMTRVARNDR